MPFGFGLFSIMFFLIFFLVMGVFAVTIFRGAKQWKKNNDSPRLMVEAKVVAKRTNHQCHSGGRHHMAHTTTTYYATFEVKSGDRMELQMSGPEYGLLLEGDFGELTFQGTRYLGFQRKVKSYDDAQ